MGNYLGCSFFNLIFALPFLGLVIFLFIVPSYSFVGQKPDEQKSEQHVLRGKLPTDFENSLSEFKPTGFLSDITDPAIFSEKFDKYHRDVTIKRRCAFFLEDDVFILNS